MNDIFIDLDLSKEPYIKDISDDLIINLTGESGSGKSTYANKWSKDNNYHIVDTDIIFGKGEPTLKEDKVLRDYIKEKISKSFNDILYNDFDKAYKLILEYYKNSSKIIVIDSAQFRNIKDVSILKGKVIIIRTSINECYKRCLNRYITKNPNASEEELEKYKVRKKEMFNWYKKLNEFIERINKI